MKDEEHPLKAHLRGAIALINDRKAKRLETPSSKTIDDAVQVQIVSFERCVWGPIVNFTYVLRADQNKQRT